MRMFEGKPPIVPEGHDSHRELAGVDSLRPLTWSDLRARLEAARDFRASMRQGEDGEIASFDAVSARRIAALSNSKHGVNPSDLANRKQNCGTSSPLPNDAPQSAPRN
jgi:hypothetical protein